MLEQILSLLLTVTPCMREAPDPVAANLQQIARAERTRQRAAVFAQAMDEFQACLDDYDIPEGDNDGHCDDPREW